MPVSQPLLVSVLHERHTIFFWSRLFCSHRVLVAIVVFWMVLFGIGPVMAELSLWPVKFKAQASPWRVWGSSGYQLTSNMNKDRKSSLVQVSTSNVNLSRNFQGYVWKPWVVRWNTSMIVGGTSMQNKVYTSPNDQDSDSDSLARNVYGGLDFTVLPESRFPFKVYYNRTSADSSEGTGTHGGQGTMREGLGFSQDYKNQEGDLRMVLRLDHSRDVMGSKNIAGMYGVSMPSIDQKSGFFNSDTLSLGITKTFEGHFVDLAGKHYVTENAFEGTKTVSQDDSVIFNHAMTGSKVWSASSLGNFSKLHTVAQSTQRDEGFFSTWQLGNFASWRSEEMPLMLSNSVRVGSNTQQYASDGAGKAITRHVSLVTGGNYQVSPAMAVNAAVTGNYQESETPGRLLITQDSSQFMSANYSPERVPMGAFMHNWFVTSAINAQESMGSRPVQTLNVAGGQSLTQDVDLGNARLLNFSANQVSFMNHSADIKPLFGITHSLNGRYSQINSVGKSFLDLALTDSHALGDTVNNAQALNTQVSIEGILLQKTTWRGHLTSQATRGSAKGAIVTGLFSSADIQVQHTDLFDVPGLLFTSRLQIDARSQFLPVFNLVGVVAENEFRSWWNFLDFNVGKMSARMTLGVTETQGKTLPFERTGLFLLQVQRFFDTTFTQWSVPDFLLPQFILKREKEDE